MADQTIPPDYGIYCLLPDGSDLVALSRDSQFRSTDGGITWKAIDGFTSTCDIRLSSKSSVQIGSDPALLARYTRSHSIETSSDGGKSWERDPSPQFPSEAQVASYIKNGGRGLDGAQLYDAILEPRTGNTVLAMGTQGVLVRTKDGNHTTWRRLLPSR